jgi:hypothetical protein
MNASRSVSANASDSFLSFAETVESNTYVISDALAE